MRISGTNRGAAEVVARSPRRAPGSGSRVPAAGHAGGARRFTGASRADGINLPAPVRSRQRGFTLLEIIVVMTIIAAATLLGAMAATGGFERMRVQSSTKEIAANLRYTRTQAIATGVPQRFVIDPRGHAWQAPNDRRGTIPASLGVYFVGAREVQPDRDSGAIVFFDDGASTGGRVRIAGEHAAWNVDVAWLTGEVTVARAEEGQ